MWKTPEPDFPVRLTYVQRQAIASLLPEYAGRLQLDQRSQRTLRLALSELRRIHSTCRAAVHHAATGAARNSLRLIINASNKAIEQCEKKSIHCIPASERLYQLRISLRGITPRIWRRIQTKDCSLHRLHLHIQTAMGWWNYHLYRFEIGDVVYGDLKLLCGEFEEEPQVVESHHSRLSKVVPEDGSRYAFSYEYDFGDRWRHNVLFEGCLRATPGVRYPICLEGERACPPEDVGGIHGYREYLDSLADPEHEEYEESSEWRGPFQPEAFDAGQATEYMRRGRIDCRSKHET